MHFGRCRALEIYTELNGSRLKKCILAACIFWTYPNVLYDCVWYHRAVMTNTGDTGALQTLIICYLLVLWHQEK